MCSVYRKVAVALSQHREYVTSWMIGVQFPEGEIMGIFLFAIASRPALGPTQLPIQRIQGALTLE